VLVSDAEQEIAAEFTIELKCSSEAVGKAQRTVPSGNDVRVSCGRMDDGDAVGGEFSDALGRNLGKDCDVERNFVVEKANPSADGGAIVLCGSEHEADAGSGIESF
jgi:hypothetical protein